MSLQLQHPTGTQTIQGLSTQEALTRLRRYGPNEPTTARHRVAFFQFVLLLLNPLSVTLILASAVAASLGEHTDALIIVTIVTISTIVNFAQSYRSQRAAERLRAATQPTATVLRDGRWQTIPRRELVPGDIISLAAGDLIPADARLLEAKDLHVQQAALTGESLPVEKQAKPEHPAAIHDPFAPHMVFLGTSVISGTAIAEVVATGPATLFGASTHVLSTRTETTFERDLRQFSFFITRTIFFLVLFVVVVNLGLRRPLIDALLFALALAVGLTPEFLPMITTIALGTGALHMARQRVIVKHLAAIENIGSMDVLCSDKTGTLTQGTMRLISAEDSTHQESSFVRLLAWLNSTYQTGLPSPFDAAILQDSSVDSPSHQKIDEIPFDFERRRVSVVVQVGEERLLITKGAPEHVLPLCNSIWKSGSVAELDEATHATIARRIEELSRQGHRVIAVAYRVVQVQPVYTAHDEDELCFAGLLVFADLPLPEAAGLLRTLREHGVRVKVLSGDNELVTRHVCETVGIDTTRLMTGHDLDRLSDTALSALVEDVDVFARVSPTQKHRIIIALQRRGHTVGFLGDGINDAPALHSADVGISVATGTEIAREAADIILLDRSLQTILTGVLEGRRAFAAVLKFLLMETSSNFGNVFSMAGAALFLSFLPMLPGQILLNNFLYDLAQISIPHDHVDPEFIMTPRRWNIRLLRDFMLLIGPISSLFDFLTFGVLLSFFHATQPLFHTGWFAESLATQCLVLFVIRTPGSPLRSRPSAALAVNVTACVLTGLSLPFTPLGRLFGLRPLPMPYLVFIVVATVTYLTLVNFAKRPIFRRYGLYTRHAQTRSFVYHN